jgi:2-(3-amino-3-carboxypropyl)histidine synthase
MEQDKTPTSADSNGDHPDTPKPAEGARQPKKRFVGRKTAEALVSKVSSPNSTIENGVALHKGNTNNHSHSPSN